MGTDDLFHKRREQRARDLQRREELKEPYDRVLIVCEGAKTEPNYFKELSKDKRLSNANIEIIDSKFGSDPMNVVNFAVSYGQKDDYDKIYCVFDRDCHNKYFSALEKIRQHSLGENGVLKAATSVPCFEFWLLLHFKFTTRPFGSGCEDVIKLLSRYLPDYKKGNRDIYMKTKDRLNTAINHAKQVQHYHETSGSDDPSTNIHELVEYLIKLKQQ